MFIKKEKRLQWTHAVEYYSAVKRSKLLMQILSWKNLKSISFMKKARPCQTIYRNDFISMLF